MTEPRVPANFSIVTLGVADLDRAIAFYLGLGWEQRGDRAAGIVWFKTAGTWIGLFPDEHLAADAGVERADSQPLYRGSTLAINLPSEEAVDAAFEHVRGLGAETVKAATKADWGGYSGYFADPDGHLWELCYNPFFPIDEHGRIEIS